MIEQDTIQLLQACDSGIKRGVSTIEKVLSHGKNPDFRKLLTQCHAKRLIRPEDQLVEDIRPYL